MIFKDPRKLRDQIMQVENFHVAIRVRPPNEKEQKVAGQNSAAWLVQGRQTITQLNSEGRAIPASSFSFGNFISHYL